jgi:hypothetical protein
MSSPYLGFCYCGDLPTPPFSSRRYANGHPCLEKVLYLRLTFLLTETLLLRQTLCYREWTGSPSKKVRQRRVTWRFPPGCSRQDKTAAHLWTGSPSKKVRQRRVTWRFPPGCSRQDKTGETPRPHFSLQGGDYPSPSLGKSE